MRRGYAWLAAWPTAKRAEASDSTHQVGPLARIGARGAVRTERGGMIVALGGRYRLCYPKRP
ncbi:MAG TPA: hypothetical protein VNL16_03965, partial [Chloroflexota bacterium]|nr:hypothetical protein [Chloroflexota bacterium]